MKGSFKELMAVTAPERLLLKDERVRALIGGVLSMGWDLIYSLFNLVMGFVYRSAWFFAMFAYYLLLGVMRLFAVSFGGRLSDKLTRSRVMREVGFGMILLAGVVLAMTALSVTNTIQRAYSPVIMVGVAAFTLFNAVRAVVNVIRADKKRTVALILLRNISLVSAAGSLLSLERSVLAVFGDALLPGHRVFEGALGAVVVGFILVLGVSMTVLSNKRIQAALSAGKGFTDR